MAPAPHYEPGMKFTFDESSGKVSVAFRGRIAVLASSFADEASARAAAEAYCKRLGWKGKDNSDLHSLLAYRRAV